MAQSFKWGPLAPSTPKIILFFDQATAGLLAPGPGCHVLGRIAPEGENGSIISGGIFIP